MILISTFSYSQTNLKMEIEKLPFERHRGCDTLKNKKNEGIILGELPIIMKVDSVSQNGKKLKIIGKVKTENSGEPVANCKIWTAIFKTDYCNFQLYLGKTDNEGNFNIEFENNKNLSLYFWALSYVGYEIKIGKLLK